MSYVMASVQHVLLECHQPQSCYVSYSLCNMQLIGLQSYMVMFASLRLVIRMQTVYVLLAER